MADATDAEIPAGTAVLVGGEVVAWFAVFDETAAEWCTENHFGQWLTWRATAPKTIPLTEAEYAAAEAKAEKFCAFFQTPDIGPVD